jgi:hypothetical protein
MFQRDYVLRLIEQLAKTLGAVLTLKKARRFEEAEQVITGAAKNLVGLDIDTLLALPLDQIIALFSPAGSLDAGKCLVLAELLSEAGDVKGLRRDARTAYLSRERALGLLLEVTDREGPDRIPDPERYRSKIANLVRALIRHHESQGNFADAEDLLFDVLDARPADVDLIPVGVEMYERLLERSDEELAAGKLPRDEVEEGLSQLKARASV